MVLKGEQIVSAEYAKPDIFYGRIVIKLLFC